MGSFRVLFAASRLERCVDTAMRCRASICFAHVRCRLVTTAAHCDRALVKFGLYFHFQHKHALGLCFSSLHGGLLSPADNTAVSPMPGTTFSPNTDSPKRQHHSYLPPRQCHCKPRSPSTSDSVELTTIRNGRRRHSQSFGITFCFIFRSV